MYCWDNEKYMFVYFCNKSVNEKVLSQSIIYKEINLIRTFKNVFFESEWHF